MPVEPGAVKSETLRALDIRMEFPGTGARFGGAGCVLV